MEVLHGFLHLYEKSHTSHIPELVYLCRHMRIFAYFLLLGVLLQTCSKQLIYTDYLVNKEFIAKVLCVNKDVPQKQCNGKCHLKKQLDQDTKQQEGENQKSKSGMEVVYLSPEKLVFEMTPLLVTNHYFFYQQNINEPFPVAIFHPPGNDQSC